MFEIKSSSSGRAELRLDGKCLLRHSEDAPVLFLGRGREEIRMFRGNFDIRDRVDERLRPRLVSVGEDTLRFQHPDVAGEILLQLAEREGLLYLSLSCPDPTVNRLWLRLYAEPGEHLVGGGEQFSALDLRGRLWPIWTREQGVGRNKLTEITRLADALDGSGGDYYTTFYPQATLVSSRFCFMHLENTEYAELDLREEHYSEIALWSGQARFVFGTAGDYAGLLEKLTGLLGRQPALPDWAMRGLWLGVQGGTERAVSLEKRCRDAGVDISAVWIQDWEGKRITSFGKRLQWDWRWNRELYPDLDRVIAADADTAWMGYINPYLVEGGVLFREAKEKGYFVKKPDGTDYLFDFGEYDCGVVDLTLPESFAWYKNVIKTNLIGLGFRGWMADFGEYLPADAVCCGGSGRELHNAWPVLWARCNREAVEEAGKLGECVFFMRAGGAGSGRYSTLTWAGDQNVDWSEDEGLPSVITAALSLGMSGFGLHCCDTGGYTTLFHLHRDEELMLRWLEFSCFTPVMRTHEGNRPDSNVQLYDSERLLAAAARLTRIHDALLPYLRRCAAENAARGLPVMRPLFFEAPGEARAWDHRLYSYLLGQDLLIAPVVEPGTETRTLWLPEGEWVHLWTGRSYGGGEHTVPAPIGQPPVFRRARCADAALFDSLRAK
ncbi:MAG: alpha-glucosidase [Oscillospiraceae bacterium]|nr:alpha-glucosidase [Oscillospiraceae bacterium]